MTGSYCSAFGCTNSTNKSSYCKERGISFHRFPLTNQELLMKWLISIRRKDFYPSKYTVICSEHFVEENFKYQPFTKVRQLKSDAVPTVFCFNADSERETTTNEIEVPMSQDAADFRVTTSHWEEESTQMSQDVTCFRVRTSQCEADFTPKFRDAACQTDYNYNELLKKNTELEKEVAALKEQMKQSDIIRIIYIGKSKIS